jgi:4-diphosphocytidyl-2-C-methyl-D-erythritol kinase
MPMPALIEDGRAKVNLTLRVVGRRTDGYHDIESVVAFADCADPRTISCSRLRACSASG